MNKKEQLEICHEIGQEITVILDTYAENIEEADDQFTIFITVMKGLMIMIFDKMLGPDNPEKDKSVKSLMESFKKDVLISFKNLMEFKNMEKTNELH